MKRILARYIEGAILSIWEDHRLPRETHHANPHRASRIEVIEEGSKRGLFFVDFEPLFQMTKNPKYLTCLTETFTSYDDARKAEVNWLRENYIGGSDEQSKGSGKSSRNAQGVSFD